MGRKLSLLMSAVVWTMASSARRIDTHHHAVPQVYRDAVEAAGGDGTGYTTPEWTLDDTFKSMDKVGSSHGVISVTTPGPPIAGTGEEGRQLARDINEYFGNVTTEGKGHERLSFFGSLPDFRDVEGTVGEIDYLYKTQKLAHGVTICSTYGDKGIGHEDFKPIWDRLNSYKSLVFVHPTSIPGVQPDFLGGGLPSPIADFPLATTRAAIDLVLSGRMGESPNVDVILSHAGGTIPYIGSRVIGSLLIPEVADKVAVDNFQASRDFARFYHDIALSTSGAQLNGLLEFTEPSKILFGSDFPYAAQFAIDALTLQYESFVKTNARGEEIAPEVLRKNAMKLLEKHEQGIKFEENS